MTVPQLVAHRGWPKRYPENTLIGIEAAMASGARFVETDVQIARDRIPVLFHDRDLRRVCGVDGAVHEYRYDELWAMHAAEPKRFGDRFREVHIPRLAELGHLLRRHPEVSAFIELKRQALDHFGTRTVLDLVRRALKPALARCVLISYSLEALEAARRDGWPLLGAVIDKWEERNQEIISAIRPQYLFCDVEGLPREGRLHVPGMSLGVFEVADARTALRLAARGVQLIETFEIGEMREALARLVPSR
jgi:glycerophosphoryl diester phosphodiesterase